MSLPDTAEQSWFGQNLFRDFHLKTILAEQLYADDTLLFSSKLGDVTHFSRLQGKSKDTWKYNFKGKKKTWWLSRPDQNMINNIHLSSTGF